ncbi:protein SMG7L isoform X2 [Cynara cardunculus var. scolymus]|uniref:protein SMG7L isoform X2 n=1 Tax=Cynara cardunculus var. scolymus TaxID=59895 RepID=UPI000D627563|nr:protein SMG7L isoform X2 [Cynara cardunculus var. scolymus]
MIGNPPATLRDLRDKQTSFLEVVNAEKLLWATIQYKGISHAEVKDLYRKVRSGYEKIILNDYQAVDLQEVEYSLWKLHYKHIDEYRKKIKKVSTSAESTNLNSQVEGFKLFLSEVAEFYKDLIAKFRRTCGLSEEMFLFKKSGGDLSRYMELCRKPDVQKWAVAATYYLEATTVWPQSGNPQNQLALLATYIGDDFLALYHCIRSLAVKEPFPDALDNIMLLFEKNKSSQLQSLSTDAHIDFSKPLKRLSSQIKSHSSMDSTNINKLGANDHVLPAKTDVWPLFVRMISFFVVKPSFEDLPHTFASTMKELEALLALNDAELNSSLEPYEQFDSSRRGPYRSLQAVAILIFVIQNLIKTPELMELKGKKDEQLSTCTSWAWTCTFSFLGHLIQRCLTSNDQVNCCSLLPSVLVFVEWYVGMLDFAETYGKDEKVSNAKSYFFGALVDLLSGFDVKEHHSLNSANQTALWEDYELMGFGPVSQSNDLFDFSTHTENRRKFEAGNSVRITRILHASMKIADRLKGSSQSPIIYNQSARKFCSGKDPEKLPKKNERDILEAMEEEEVILFKPLTRYNSEPIQTSNDEPVDDQTETSDEGLRRSASLFAAQNGSHDSSKKSPPYSAGPPSLSAWVLNRESVSLERERGSGNPNKKELAPISEIAVATNDEPYVAPIPSAPLLPEDPVWLTGSSSKEGAPPVSSSTNFHSPQEPLDLSSGVAGFVDAYRPPVFGLSSAEWLYRYTHNLSLEPSNGNHHWPILPTNPSGNLGKIHGYDGGSRFDVIDRWGNPLLTNRMVYFENPNLVYGGGGGGGGGSGVRAEQPPLLQHLKEREWQLQTESPFSGNPYMGN